jgi:hypothetical protein
MRMASVSVLQCRRKPFRGREALGMFFVSAVSKQMETRATKARLLITSTNSAEAVLHSSAATAAGNSGVTGK